MRFGAPALPRSRRGSQLVRAVTAYLVFFTHGIESLVSSNAGKRAALETATSSPKPTAPRSVGGPLRSNTMPPPVAAFLVISGMLFALAVHSAHQLISPVLNQFGAPARPSIHPLPLTASAALCCALSGGRTTRT